VSQTHFDPTIGLVLVEAKLVGPARQISVTLALDTGATQTVVNAAILRQIGCGTSLSRRRIAMTTGSDVEFVPAVEVRFIEALGRERAALRVISHTLPSSAKVDGLLGPDFLRGNRLVIDFKQGTIDID
jgi:hypothetical protein